MLSPLNRVHASSLASLGLRAQMVSRVCMHLHQDGAHHALTDTDHAADRAIRWELVRPQCHHGGMGKEPLSQTFAHIAGPLDPVVGDHDPDAGTWPSPMRDRQWLDDAEKNWHMRGDRLDPRRARSVMAQPDVRVLHCYGMHPQEVSGAERQALFARLEKFFEGHAPPMSTFDVAEFRDEIEQ